MSDEDQVKSPEDKRDITQSDTLDSLRPQKPEDNIDAENTTRETIDRMANDNPIMFSNLVEEAEAFASQLDAGNAEGLISKLGKGDLNHALMVLETLAPRKRGEGFEEYSIRLKSIRNQIRESFKSA